MVLCPEFEILPEEIPRHFWRRNGGSLHPSNKWKQSFNFFLLELLDLPGNLIRQHWPAIRKENTPMNKLFKNNMTPTENPQPGNWGAAIMAGLPQLLLGVLISLGKFSVFDIYDNSQILSVIVGITLFIMCVAVLVYAWRRGWPLWSATWYLYGIWGIIAILSLTIESLNLEESWRYTNVLFLSWMLICVIGYFLLLIKSKMHGLLSVAFLFPILGTIMFEFIPNPIEAWFAIGVTLLAAISAGVIIRIGDFRLSLGLVLGFNTIVGLVWAYISEYKMLDLPAGIPVHVPKFSNFFEFLALYSIFGLGIVALPFIFRGLWNMGKRKFT